jgi:hypothetical protein
MPFAAWQITITPTGIFLTLGVLGFLLSVSNFIVDLRRNRIRLKVSPVTLLFFPAEGGHVNPASFFTNARGEKIPNIWGVEVTNFGVPVKIKEVGWLVSGSTLRASIMKQFAMTAVDLPHLLERHDSVSIYGEISPHDPSLADYKCAYVRTSGKQFTGTTKQFLAMARKCRI